MSGTENETEPPEGFEEDPNYPGLYRSKRSFQEVLRKVHPWWTPGHEEEEEEDVSGS